MKHIHLILAMLLLCSCAETAEVDTFGSIKGTVMDKIIMEPLSGASVTISPLGKSMITNSNGEFEFTELEPQKYTVSVSKNQYNSDSKSVTVEPGIASQADFSIMTGNGAIELSKTTLDFGTSDNVLVFDIENIGKNELFFDIEDGGYDWLEVAPKSGKIDASRIEPITVTIDRDKIDDDKNITLPISSNAGSDEIEVNVSFDANSPQLSLSKSALDFGETETELFFEISNKGKSDLIFEIAEEKSWLSISCDSYTVKPSGYVQATAKIDRSLITKDENTSILISSNGGSKEIDIEVKYVESRAIMSISKNELDFGETLTQLSFDVENTGNAVLEYEIIANNENWITVSPQEAIINSGQTKTIMVSINRDNINSDISYTLIVSSNVGSKEILIKVTQPILMGELSVSTNSLAFGENYDQKNLTIYNKGTASFDFNLLGNYPWLTVSEASGTISAGSSKYITVYIDRNKIFGNVAGTLAVSSDVGDEQIAITAYEPIDYGTADIYGSNFQVEATDSYVSSSDLYIAFKITNNGSDCSSYQFGTPYNLSVYAIDDLGNMYDYNNRSLSITIGSLTAYDWLPTQYLSSFPGNGASLAGLIKIKDISSSASTITILKFGVCFNNMSSNSGYCTFANVPIIR